MRDEKTPMDDFYPGRGHFKSENDTRQYRRWAIYYVDAGDPIDGEGIKLLMYFDDINLDRITPEFYLLERERLALLEVCKERQKFLVR
jgi:hypothetical protein